MSDQGNIFFTYENLAFSLPLITVVTTYLFFKFVPPVVSALLIAGALMVYQIRRQLAAAKERKLQNLDEAAVREILGDLEGESDGKEKDDSKQQQKAKNKVQQRLAQERKAEARKAATNPSKKGKNKDFDDDDDEDDLLKFVKGSRQPKNKNQ